MNLRKLIKLFLRYPTPFTRKLVDSDPLLTIKRKKTTSNDLLFQVTPDDFFLGMMRSILSDLQKAGHVETADILVTRGVNAAVGIAASSWVTRTPIFNRVYMRPWVNCFKNSNSTVHGTNNTPIKIYLINIYNSYKIWADWKIHLKSQSTKKTIVFNDIKIDDLIIDTYLRFRPSAAFKVDDIFVWYLIHDSLNQIYTLNRIFRQKKYRSYLTSYTTYTTHGIPVRVAHNHGVRVYSFGNISKFCQEITKEFPYHSQPPVKSEPNNTMHSKSVLRQARKGLRSRFSGKTDLATAYMKRPAYHRTMGTGDATDIEGSAVIFLHDFFDSPHMYDNFIFHDFDEWTKKTIQLLIKNDVKFCIKTHPNQMPESKKYTELLKEEYPKLNWLDPNVNNLSIIKNKPKIGITVYGTIAGELAYFGIPSICCSTNPHSNFSFCKQASDELQYCEAIKSIRQLSLNKNIKLGYRLEAIEYYSLRNSSGDHLEQELVQIYTNYWLLTKKNRDEHPSTALDMLSQLRRNKGYHNMLLRVLK